MVMRFHVHISGVVILVISVIDFSLGVHAYHSIGKSSIELFYQFGYTMVNVQFCIMCKILDFAFIELHKTLKHIVVNSTRIYFTKNKEDKDKFLHEKKKEILGTINKFRRLKVLVSKLNSEYKHELLFLILIYMNYTVLASNFVHRAFKQFDLRSFMYPFWKLCKFAFQISFLCFSCDALVKDAIAIPRLLLQFNLLLSEQSFLNMLHIFLHSLAVYKLEIKVMRIVKINKQLILLIIAFAAPFIVLYAEQINFSPKDASVNILFLLPPKDKISLW
uniref:Gustatory receptor n=1 Tax=Cacopsylla melanoneura TaxID=428564 RepID=A0A8D8RD86_9HEMI